MSQLIIFLHNKTVTKKLYLHKLAQLWESLLMTNYPVKHRMKRGKVSSDTSRDLWKIPSPGEAMEGKEEGCDVTGDSSLVR